MSRPGARRRARHRHRGHARRAALLAGALALAGVACLAVAAVDREAGPALAAVPAPADVPATPAAATTGPPAPAASPGPAAAGVVPQWLRISDIGVRSDLLSLGLQDDRTVEVPDDPDRAGWFELGTVPGERGSAVVLGHVDSVDGPAVFARLGEVVAGSRIEVGRSDGAVVTFRVRAVRSYANADFPAEKVYRGGGGGRLLTLVTCGGEYDATRGGYQSNVVVYAHRVRDARGPA